MRLLLALLLPWFQFFTIGRPIAGIICLILQITIIGWIPAAIWSVYALSQYKTDRKIEAALRGKSERAEATLPLTALRLAHTNSFYFGRKIYTLSGRVQIICIDFAEMTASCTPAPRRRCLA